MKDCIFCRIVSSEIPCKKVFEDGEFLAFFDIKPSAPVHIILIPKQHLFANLGEAKPQDKALLGKTLLTAVSIAKQEGILENFRVRTNTGKLAGQTVFHLHFHIQGGWTEEGGDIN